MTQRRITTSILWEIPLHLGISCYIKAVLLLIQNFTESHSKNLRRIWAQTSYRTIPLVFYLPSPYMTIKLTHWALWDRQLWSQFLPNHPALPISRFRSLSLNRNYFSQASQEHLEPERELLILGKPRNQFRSALFTKH